MCPNRLKYKIASVVITSSPLLTLRVDTNPDQQYMGSWISLVRAQAKQ